MEEQLEKQETSQSITIPPVPPEPNMAVTENHFQSKVETMPATLSCQQKLLELDERPNMLKHCDCEVGQGCWRGKHQ